METIKNYLDNMFSTLPKTSEVEHLKNELLSNMEDKYVELKAQGKTENECIGIVISEFGNIDELVNELELPTTNETENELHTMSKEETITFLNTKKHTSFLVSIGVSLCIIGAAILILFSELSKEGIILSRFSEEARDTLSLIPLFVLLVPAIALFIYSAMKMEKYKFIEKGDFTTSIDTKAFLKEEFETFRPKFAISIIVGVCLCVLSPISIFIGNTISKSGSTYGTVVLLLIVTIAVFLFINFGSRKETYKRLLQIEEYSIKERENNKFIGAISSVVWSIAVCVYLLINFVFGLWYISWIIFPIIGILHGAFQHMYSETRRKC